MIEQIPGEFLIRLAKGIAAQFGRDCEVAIHDVGGDHAIIHLENGHISGRQVGDGPSRVVLEALRNEALHDRFAYLTRTHDGRILKSTTVYIRDGQGAVQGIFSINYDIMPLMMAQEAMRPLLLHEESEPPSITRNVEELLTELMEQSVRAAGKPVALMNKEDKMRAIRFLNDAGAFLITRAGDRISQFFGISKYTMYSYMEKDAKNA